MERSTVKKANIATSLVAATFLLFGVSFSAGKVEAAPTVQPTAPGVQLAWWHHGYYYHRYYRHGCYKHCWRNRWGYVRCSRRCY